MQREDDGKQATVCDEVAPLITDEVAQRLLCDEVMGEFEREVLDGTTSERSGGDYARDGDGREGFVRDGGLRSRVEAVADRATGGSEASRRGNWVGTAGKLKPLLQSSMLRYCRAAGRMERRSRRQGQRRRPGIYFPGLVGRGMAGARDGRDGRGARGGVNQPSRFCHICLRRAERVALMACGRFRSGLCRKVVCERCFAEFGYDWEQAVGAGSDWVCTHCRKM